MLSAVGSTQLSASSSLSQERFFFGGGWGRGNTGFFSPHIYVNLMYVSVHTVSVVDKLPVPS